MAVMLVCPPTATPKNRLQKQLRNLHNTNVVANITRAGIGNRMLDVGRVVYVPTQKVSHILFFASGQMIAMKQSLALSTMDPSIIERVYREIP